MSLINQALRKAQRDRSPQRMPESGAESPAVRPVTGSAGMKPGLVIGLVVAVAVLFGLVLGLSLLLFRGSGAESDGTQLAANAAQADPQPTAAKPPAGADSGEQANIEPPTPPSPKPANESSLERASAPPVVEELRQVRDAAELKAAAEAEAEAAKAAKAQAAAEPSQAVIDWLARAQISGVKISPTESKVILNGKPFTVGEYVNFTLRLKVLIIQEKRVLFIDPNGKKYMKQL